jgi:hypothetical protein
MRKENELKITTRIRKIVQSNALSLKEKVTSFNYKAKKTNNTSDVYERYEENQAKKNSTNKFKTAKVVFQERKNRRAIIENFLVMRLSFLKFRRNTLRAMYATKNGYKTCDYSKKKGFYNFQ